LVSSQLITFTVLHGRVGRIDLVEGDSDVFPSLEDMLAQANTTGYRLVYLTCPPIDVRNGTLPPLMESVPAKPGLLVDWKTTLSLQLWSLDSADLVRRAFQRLDVQIRRYQGQKDDLEPSKVMLDLAVESGAYSRFNIDPNVSNAGYRAMFETWFRNSIAGKAADEVFVVVDKDSGSLLGFVTVQKKGINVSIGLLAVHDSARRKGLASALLSRAALWALEELGNESTATMTVVTQGSNEAALACYERFGFRRESVQEVRHVWLPDHLHIHSRSDQGPIPFCRQHFTGKEKVYVEHLLTTSLDSASQYTFMCSSKIKAMLGNRSTRVLITPSGTAALEMAALLCDLQPGDEVIVPSYTFSSTANAFVLRGAKPVFVDVRSDTLNIDETLIEAAITHKTKAICVVHYAGVACEMDTICAIAKKAGLIVIEDAAQAFLSTYKGRPLGSIGDFGCFSFHYTKNVIGGEAGALTINQNETAAARAVVMWEKGTNRYDFVMGKVDKYRWIDVGSSFVPNELTCAVLWAQLEDAQWITSRRIQLFDHYHYSLQTLEQTGLCRLCTVPSDTTTNGHIFYVLFKDETTREFFSNGLKSAGIAAFSHYLPLHSSPAGLKYGRVGSAMDITDSVHNTLLRLPIWVDLSNQQIDVIVSSMLTLSEMCLALQSKTNISCVL
jgi:dTDP-4-amino-4,6-dideoxygalactose transaminase